MLSEQTTVVLGIDGGGTHTRVMVADLFGNILSFVEQGSSSIHKDLEAKNNVHKAIYEAVTLAGKELHQVQAVVAGIAGYDSESDLEWVQGLTDLEELHCLKWHVNDAVVAHSGALMSRPGIIVISGTGSIIFAVTEAGKHIRNYDLHHYAASAARFIGYDATYEVLSGNFDKSDSDLLKFICHFWEVQSIQELSQKALQGFISDRRERDRQFAKLAPLITEAALNKSNLAQLVCDRAIHQIIVGVKMLASYFSEHRIQVSLVGSVVHSPYFKQKLAEKMNYGNDKHFELIPPSFSPVAGAVLMALRHVNVTIEDKVLENINKHQRAKHE